MLQASDVSEANSVTSVPVVQLERLKVDTTRHRSLSPSILMDGK